MFLPTPLAWIKKTLRILKSNLSPNQIALGFSLGIFAGLPPMGMHVLLPCSVALLFRCSFRSFLLSLGLFKLLSLAVAPGTFAIGRWLLDASRGLDAFWRWVFHLPVLAPMGYSRYLLLGSLVVALLLAVPVFLLVRWTVIRYRASFARWVFGWRLSGWLRGKQGVGLARRFLAGGDAKYETVPPPRGPFRVIRKGALIGLPVLYTACYLLAAVIVPFFAGTIATSTASWIVGSEVAAEDAEFNLFTGVLTLSGLSVQDPKQRDENLVEIPSLTLDVGISPLLSKRVVFNRVVIADATLHVKREEDGTLNIDNPSSGWDADGYLEWATRQAREVDWLGLLRRFVEFLGRASPLSPYDDPYARYHGGRSFPAVRPPFTVERIEIGRILVALEDHFAETSDGPLPPLTLLEVEISHLAFPPNLRTEPIHVQLRGRFGDDPESGFRLSAVFESNDSGSGHTYEFAMTRIDLPRIARFYASTLPVQIVSGKATVSGALRLKGETAEGEVSFLLEEFEIAGVTDRPLFGLPDETSARVIEGINRYAEEIPVVFGSAVEGASSRPTLAWEAPLLEIARQGLLMTGKRELRSTIEQLGIRVDALGGTENAPLNPEFEAIQHHAEGAARRIIENAASGTLVDLPLFGTDPTEPSPGDTTSDPAELLPSLLQRLLEPPPAEDGEDPE